MLSFAQSTVNPVNLFLLEVALKGALVIAVAWAAAAIALRCRSSAATRHVIWSLGICGALALPVLDVSLPNWDVRVDWQAAASRSPARFESAQVEVERGTDLLAWTPTPSIASASLLESSPEDEPSIPAALSKGAAGGTISENDLLSGSGLTWALLGWLAGAGLALMPLGLALASLWNLARRARIVTAGRLAAALAEAKSQLGMSCDVRLLQSPSRAMPMTWGICRTKILLPAGAEDWPAERLNVVLLHELAHVQRRDCLVQMLGQVVRAIYWFNPLMWLAEHQLRSLQEQACDDLVLGQGFAAPDYAEHLLAVAAGFRSTGPTAAVAQGMARQVAIERRIVSILRAQQNRRALSPRRMGLLAATAASIVCLLSALHIESATAESEQAGQATAQSPATKGAGDQAQERDQGIEELRAKIAEQYVSPVDQKTIAQGAIKGMIGALGDPYSELLTPETVATMEKTLAGSIVGIGVHLEMHEKQLRVVTALPDSPALAAGIQPEDLILQIDGKPTAGIGLPAAVKQIAGPQGSVVRLKIGRAGNQETQIDVTRGPVKLPTVKGFRRGADHRWDFMLDGNQKIGYAQVTMYGNATPEELRTSLTQMKEQGLKGLILDLRFCPGGSLEAAVNSAKLFLNSGTIVSLHGREGSAKTIKADAADVLSGSPMVVLVSSQTASAGEVVAGALQDNKRALVLGTRTLGKGSVQSLIQLVKADGTIKLTTAHYQLPSGRNIDKRAESKSWGIDPDEGYFVPVDRAKMKVLLTRVERDVIGGKSGGQANENAQVTAQWIEETQGDPQLAAALKTLTTRLQTGAFAKVSSLSQAQIEQFLKREDIEQRREAVQQNLEKLNQELAELEKEGTVAK